MKINTILISILGSLTDRFFLSVTFAPKSDDKPRAIRNKIKKRSLKPFYVKPGNSLTFKGGILIFLTLMISCANPTKDAGENASAEGTLAVQLWTFRYDLEKDVPGTLKKIKTLGINYVEGFDASYIG